MNDCEMIDVIAESTKELSKNIKAINKETVHKICSGQVVLSLAVAVKELVENSIDAGATMVEIKVKDHGLESVEVVDNGCGVEKSNFEGLTAKYHTSKIRDFMDLETVSTFGFRGEALSSLCGLSDMIITTRHASVDVATRLELDHEGNIKKQTPCSRPVGTTVILTNLFSTLPVRRREFVKNIKKEFAKMCQILQAYCLVSKNVRIICTNHTPKGSSSTLMSTSGNGSVLDNIQSVFGVKQTADLMEIAQPLEENEKFTLENIVSKEDLNSSIELIPDDFERLNACNFKIDGWISSCKHGSGRSSKDRQFFFINSRPCDPKNISKLVNEIYHRYNVHQNPFVFLNILINRSNVDVNLTPDKRQILLNHEKVILLTLKKALLKTFTDIPSTFKFENSMLNHVLKQEQNVQDVDSEDEYKIKPNHEKFVEVLSQWKATGQTTGPRVPLNKSCKRKPPDDIIARTFKLKKIQEILSQEKPVEKVTFESYASDPESEKEDETKIFENDFSLRETQSNAKAFDDLMTKEAEDIINAEQSQITCNGENDEADTSVDEKHVIDCKIRKSIQEVKLKIQEATKEKDDEALDDTEIELLLDSQIEESQIENFESTDCIKITIDEIKKLALDESNKLNEKLERPKLQRLKFKTEINPSKNKNAEEELQREVSKDMFATMEIIGQFNLGFIIAKLDDDLFIIDQHATDEKYNFETLQKTVKLQNQNLVIPQSLELTAVNELILMDNLKVFEMNGFKFHIDENAPVTQKVKLLAKPYSSNWEFGKEDIDELIFMLQDAPPHTVCRPSRIRAMFASRACRKSVMVGKALRKSTMRKLVQHMGELEHPWNCPHGRPTMRHLINHAMLESD